MKDRHFLILFFLGYFLSFDAVALNEKAGTTAFFASVAGATLILTTQEKKVE